MSCVNPPAGYAHMPPPPQDLNRSHISASDRPRNGLAHILNPPYPASGPVQTYHTLNNRTYRAYEENGRLYHAWNRGAYPYPCDESERNRFDGLHHLIYCFILGHRRQMIVDGYPRKGPDGEPITESYAAPIVNQTPMLVLDVGCGTGIWANDMANRYPEAHIIGADLVGGQIQPRNGDNLEWRTPDAGDDMAFDMEAAKWPFTPNTFDLIHLGHACGSVSSWPTLYSKIFRHLRRHTGQVEHIEIDLTPRCDDGTLPAGSAIEQWWTAMKAATTQKPLAYRQDTEQLLRDAGFVDIMERKAPLPFHAAPGNKWVGACYRSLISNDVVDPIHYFHGLSLGPLTRNLGWERERVDYVVKEVLKEVADGSVHLYHMLHVWTARRP